MKSLNFENIIRLSVERRGKKLSEKGVEQIDLESLGRFRVERARDLVADPLSVKEFFRRPFLSRSRWLVSGYDVDANQVRTFYVGGESLLKVALYGPGSARPVWPFPRPFGPSRQERRLLVAALQQWLTRDLYDLRLRVYCDDLRVVA